MLVVISLIRRATSKHQSIMPKNSRVTKLVHSQDGSSEEVIGEWMEARGNRDQIILSTKVLALHNSITTARLIG